MLHSKRRNALQRSEEMLHSGEENSRKCFRGEETPKNCFTEEKRGHLMSGSTGSGDLTAGDEGSPLGCSTEEGLSERFKVTKVWQLGEETFTFLLCR